MKRAIIFFVLIILLTSCSEPQDKAFTVDYKFQTPPVRTMGDAADDPAIRPDSGLILATDKTAGIYIYDNEGNEIYYIEGGEPNNVDVRDDWIAFTDRSDNTVKYTNLSSETFVIDTNMAVYGICIGFINSELRAIVTEEEGVKIQYWNLLDQILLQTIDITADEDNIPLKGNEAEGCVIDDENGHIFISREGSRGYLKAFDAETLELIKVVDSRDGNINGDPEGVTIYKQSQQAGFIILSSQGDNKFNMYDRSYPFSYLGSFKINGVEDTDGIDVTNQSFKHFPKGFMVAQDGKNLPNNQNFKIVDMEEILKKKLILAGSIN